jgi:hypothetical protein
MPVLSAPRGIEDLTSEWLTAALSEVSDEARVENLVGVPIGNGNVASSIRLIPDWDRPTPAPASVVAKVPSSEELSRATGFATRTYELEAAFYNELAGTVWVNRPTCYLARFEPEEQGYVVLLEDLGPSEAGDQILGCSPEEAAAVMPELAALHAPRWGDPSLIDLTWLDRPTPEAARGATDFISILYSGFVDRYRERVEPEVLALCERFMPALENYLTDRPYPWTVVHGDFRLDNLLFGGPRVVVVDWQTVKIGVALSDVSYFIGSALLPEDRRQHEANLVRSYYAFLTELGVRMPWGDCWDGYRRYSFDGLLMAIAASMLVTRTPRSDDMFMAMINRHGRQALDLGSEDYLVR